MQTVDQGILAGKKHLHFIGIGGSGMFPIVQILHGQGYHITGSDNNEGDIIDMERKMGIPVQMGQRPENIEGADLIVYSAAIMADNPELIAAKASGVPVLERSVMLGILTEQYNDCICISGTHGKTTTTAMLTQALLTAGVDPSAVIGGKLPAIQGYGRRGDSPVMVCEACEFADTFLHLKPDVAVILNIDADHLDYFGTLENIIRSFAKFAGMASKGVIINGDDANSRKATATISAPVATFGLSPENDYSARGITPAGGMKTRFELLYKGTHEADVELNIPGEYNVLNALAAYAAAMHTGADKAAVIRGISEFRGAGRRFEILGEVRGVTIADDYAHHPAELKAVLAAAQRMDFKEVYAVFQPFTYSRTAMLLDDFADALALADHVVMSEIMGSREKNTYNIYTRDLAAKIPGSVWFEGFEEMAQNVMSRVQPGDLVITLGCGDVYKCARMMLEL